MFGHFEKMFEKIAKKAPHTAEVGYAINARLIEQANKGVEVIDLE